MSVAQNAPAGVPRPLLRSRDAVAIVVGIVIGAGIFRTPPLVASVTGDPGWTIVAWIAGGVISLVGALCYAELASDLSACGRRLPLPHARLRTQCELSVCMGARDGDQHGLDRAAGVRIRRLHVAHREPGRAIDCAVGRDRGGGAHRGQHRKPRGIRARAELAHGVRGRGARARDRGRSIRLARRRPTPRWHSPRRPCSAPRDSRWCSCSSPTAAGTRRPISPRSCAVARARWSARW